MSIQDAPGHLTSPQIQSTQPWQTGVIPGRCGRRGGPEGVQRPLHTCDLNVSLFVQEDAERWGKNRGFISDRRAGGAAASGSLGCPGMPGATWGAVSMQELPAVQYVIEVTIYPVFIFAFQ